ncbi:MAG: ImmA/IrrE family metallo-endopeptidase [Elusimicrobia bacterium]|nr:ImmA/IrrE family metallo-endopeptidase [Elusimicrobiota bacterium]
MPDAASKLEIPDSHLYALEQGQADLTYSDLIKIAEKYRQPISAFFRSKTPPTKKTPPDRRSSKPAGDISLLGREAIATARRLQYLLGEALSATGETPPKFGLSAHLNVNPARAAASAREALGVSVAEQLGWVNENVALKQWRARIEGLGAAVFQLKLPNDEFRGLSISDHPTCIVIGTGDSATGKAFTLFHEAAHLALHQSSLCNPFLEGTDQQQIEGWCNTFAGAVLMPPELLAAQEATLKRLPASPNAAAPVIEKTARSFKVSRYALMTRLLVLGWIQRQQYSDLVEFMQLAKPEKSFGRSPAEAISAKRCLNRCGNHFVSTVLGGLRKGVLDIGSASSFLGTKPEHLSTLGRLLAR